MIASLILALAPLAARGGAASFPQDVVLATDTLTEVRVGDPWNFETREREYDLADMPSRLDNLLGEIFHDSPLPAAPVWYAVFDHFPRAEAERIARVCKAGYPETWDQIGCVSHEIYADLGRDGDFHGPRTWCMYHAQAFQQTFRALRLPGTWASKVDASGATIKDGHVANAIMIHGTDGRIYSYVIDSAYNQFFPARLFPLNDAAVAFHDRDGDGHTDFPRLPAIASHWPEGFRPAP